MNIRIDKIELPVAGIEDLHAEARREGYNFLDTLIDDWASGKNRFDGRGEILCGHIDRGQLIAVGGLNRDPFLDDPTIGRIRRVYVRSSWRKQGIGRALVQTLIDHAMKTFSTVRLRAENAGASRLYESMSFTPIDDPEATHIFYLQR